MKARDQEVQEAVATERARCLWILDEIILDLRQRLRNKVLVESQIHIVKVKFKIAHSIVQDARLKIISGHQPKPFPRHPEPSEPENGSSDT